MIVSYHHPESSRTQASKSGLERQPIGIATVAPQRREIEPLDDREITVLQFEADGPRPGCGARKLIS